MNNVSSEVSHKVWCVFHKGSQEILINKIIYETFSKIRIAIIDDISDQIKSQVWSEICKQIKRDKIWVSRKKKPIGNLIESILEENIKEKLFSSMIDGTSDKSFRNVYVKILGPISNQTLFQNTEPVKYNINL